MPHRCTFCGREVRKLSDHTPRCPFVIWYVSLAMGVN